VVKEIVKAMEDHVTLSIPLEVDAKASKENWGDVKEWKDIKGQFKRHMRVTV
jgi:hypothetical protein